MSGVDFLKNLKNAVDNGEFNSDAAKKINEISDVANKKFPKGISLENLNDLEKNIISLAEDGGIKTISSEEVNIINSDYDTKMNKLKKIDEINAQVAILLEIESIVCENIFDMINHVRDIETKYCENIEKNDPVYENLVNSINEIKLKYDKFINN